MGVGSGERAHGMLVFRELSHPIHFLGKFRLSESPTRWAQWGRKMDFFVLDFIKSKAYVRNYENMTDLKTSIVAAFQEMSSEMVSSTLKNMEKQLKLIIQCQGGHIENW